jgi:pyruvate dehydrogenase E2 component (dihydrolipoamide acetyltransferase)
MLREFKLPDLGEGVHEGEVLAVPVKPGQEVKEGDIILEVETDKAAVEIPSPYTGTVQEILVKPGDLVHVGDVMMAFSNGGVAEPKGPEPEKRPAPKEEAAAAPAAPQPERRKGPVPASPATRRLARELGVDLRQVTASGPQGLVTAEDVRAAAEKAAPAEAERVQVEGPAVEKPATRAAIDVPPLPDFSKWGRIERIPLRSIRKATARQMSLAWSQIPHVASQDVVEITRLEEFRQKHKEEIEAAGGKLTLTVFALKAVATALKTYPNFNASLDLAAGEIIMKDYFHIGVAVNTDDGLIVPIIRNVERKSIKELSIELADLVQRTRERKVSREELRGGSFTITNAGAMGGGHFSPIINYPEVAILGMGQARMQPVVISSEEKGHEIVPRLMMPLVLCIDHRVLDGADAIRFLQVITDALQDPDELLMTMI